MSLHMPTLRRLIAVLLSGFIASSGLAATATDLVPAAAPRGSRVVVRGSDLQTGDLAVTFPDGGSGTAATINERAGKYADVSVPATAISGGVRVTQGTTSVATLRFTVLPDTPFQTVKTLVASDLGHDLLKSPGGIAVDPVTGTIFVADSRHHRLMAISAQGITVLAGSGQPGLADGVGTAAGFKEPAGSLSIAHGSSCTSQTVRTMQFGASRPLVS